MYYNFSFLIEKSFGNLSSLLHNQFIAFEFILFLSRFSVSLKSLNNYFFRGFAYKSLLNRFSVLINYIMQSSIHFSTSSCFPRFSWSRFFWFQVFQGQSFSESRFYMVRCFSGSSFFRVRVQVLELANYFSTLDFLFYGK